MPGDSPTWVEDSIHPKLPSDPTRTEPAELYLEALKSLSIEHVYVLALAPRTGSMGSRDRGIVWAEIGGEQDTASELSIRIA